MIKRRRLTAAAMAAAVAIAASPAMAHHGPAIDDGGPAADGAIRDGNGDRVGPMTGMPMMGGGAEPSNRIARILAAEAMHQRAIGARMAVGRMMHHMAARLRAMDRNEDGAITEREFLGGMLEIFDHIDGDGDGAIGADEVRRAFAAMAEGGPHDRSVGPGDGPPALFGGGMPHR
jgi:hypothetical protein